MERVHEDSGVAADGALCLGPELTIAELEPVRRRLYELRAGDGPARLDVSRLVRTDTAGLQMLAAFARDLEAAGRPLEWVGAGDEFADAATLLGLRPLLCKEPSS